MGKASRLFATDEMKKAAREFREHAQANEFLHPDYGEVDEDKLLEDYFLAGAVWYKQYLKDIHDKKIYSLEGQTNKLGAVGYVADVMKENGYSDEDIALFKEYTLTCDDTHWAIKTCQEVLDEINKIKQTSYVT